MDKSNPPSDIPQPRKQDIPQEIAKLRQEGQSFGKIAKQLALTKSSVFRWSKALPPEAIAPQPQVPAAAGPQPLPTAQPRDPAESIRQAIEMFTAMRQELFDEWRASKVAKQVRIEEESGPADEPAAKLKKSVRTETRTGNPTYFKTALEVQKQISALEERLAALQGLPAAPADRLASLSDDDLENLSDEELDHFNDDELYAMDLRLRAKYEREGQKFDRPVLTNEQIRNMTDEERAGYRRAESPPRLEAPEAKMPDAAAAPQAAGNLAAILPPPETAAKADPPPLTWDQQHAAAVAAAAAQKAERKQRMKPYTDPRRCAYGWDGFRR